MIQIATITANSRQTQSILLDDQSVVDLHMEYKPQQLGWFFTNITWKTWQLNGRRITTSPNMLHQFRSIIPFGLGVFTTDNQEPTLQQDFAYGRASLYLLSAAEVAQFAAVLAGG